MPLARSGSVGLYYEEAGDGLPIVFVHEFAGDLRMWEPQMRYFARRYRCVAFNARGYPPSDVPTSLRAYSQRLAAEDIARVLTHLRIDAAHIVGCSMGGYATLTFALKYASRARSITLIGAGSGSDPTRRARFRAASALTATRFEKEGLAAVARSSSVGPTRIQLRNKDPRRFREFWARFREHSAIGQANTMRGVIMRRPSIYSLQRPLERLRVPIHLVVGDEDDDLLEPSIFIKRVCPAASLSVVPATGHVVSVEEPDHFNRITERFLDLVDAGMWRARRAMRRTG